MGKAIPSSCKVEYFVESPFCKISVDTPNARITACVSLGIYVRNFPVEIYSLNKDQQSDDDANQYVHGNRKIKPVFGWDDIHTCDC